MTDSRRFKVVGGTVAVKEAMAHKTVPQGDTLLPLLDAPLDDLAAYLAPDSWEDRKNYLNNMLCDSLTNLGKQIDFFKEKGVPKSEYIACAECCLLGLHIKIGQLLDAWGATEPEDEHAAALFVLSAKSEHRHTLAAFMPRGTTSPPEENELFEAGTSLMLFKNMSIACRPGLSECWRELSGHEK